MRRSLRAVLSRVNKIAERARAADGESSQDRVAAILQQARQNARLGIRPQPKSDDELRRCVRTRADAVLIERIIAGRRRYEEFRRVHGGGGVA
jgi:hypothetical protein